MPSPTPGLRLRGPRGPAGPIDVGGRASAALIPGARLVVYQGAPHGITDTHKERLGADLLAFLEAWSEFFYALVLTESLTAPPVVAGLQNLQQFSWTTLAAATVVTVIPPVIIAVGFQRYIVSGLAAGSVKRRSEGVPTCSRARS